MKCKEKEDEIELRRMRTENSLLRQRIDFLETESSDLADRFLHTFTLRGFSKIFSRLIQGQVTRAEVEENTFAMKRELAAIKQHDIDTHMKLEEAKERIKILSEQLEDQSSKTPSLEEVSLKSEIIKQKQEMIECLQEELIKVCRVCLLLVSTPTRLLLGFQYQLNFVDASTPVAPLQL